MALIVEDGTSKADAESYLSVADANIYHLAFGNPAWATATDIEKEVALRRGTAYIDGVYGPRFIGQKTSDAQALQFPRYVFGVFGWSVTTIPVAVKRAAAEAALRELASPGSLAPDITPTRVVTRQVVGPIDTTYADVKGSSAARPRVAVIDNLLAPLLTGNGSSTFVSRA